MNIMHFLSAHKGGVGKTIKALSLAYHYMQGKNNRVILVDVNPTNSDIADDMFYHFHMEELKSCSLVLNATEKVYTTSRDSSNTFSVVDATGGPIVDVIESILLTTPNDPELNYIYIIDTNAHIKNLIELRLPSPSNWRQYFWFVWGWSLPRLHHHPREIFEAVSHLESQYPARQVIHVFNIYDFFDAGFSLIKKASVTLKPLRKILRIIESRINKAKSNPDKMSIIYASSEIMLQWILSARRSLLSFRIPRDLPISKLPELWADTFEEQLQATPNEIPYNLLIIPTFFEELVMATDRLRMGELSSWKEIYQTLKPLMKFIHNWAMNLEQFGA